MMLKNQSDSASKSAIINILNAISSLPAQLIYYAAILLSIVLYWDKPAVLMAGLGVNLLSNLVERLRKGETVPDAEIRRIVQQAINESDIENLLTSDEFQRTIAKLVRRLQHLENAIHESDWKTAQELDDIYTQSETLREDFKQGQHVIYHKLNTLTTKEQILEIRQLLEHLLEKDVGDREYATKADISQIEMTGFRSIVNTSASTFAEWLVTIIAGLGDREFHLEGDSVTLKSIKPNIIMGNGEPLQIQIIATSSSPKTAEENETTWDEKPEVYIAFDTIPVSVGRVEIIARCCYDFPPTYHLYKELLEEIGQRWPETKRDIISFEFYDGLDLDTILFEYIIETDPNNFLLWCHEELGRSYPGAFTKETDHGQYVTHISGDIFPPDSNIPHWQYLIFASDILFYEGKDGSGVQAKRDFNGIIIQIDMRNIMGNRYHLICRSGTSHPQILEWIKALEKRIVLIYRPKSLPI